MSDGMREGGIRAGIVLAGGILFLTGCMPTARVTIERLAPPEYDVRGIRTVAVLPFSAPPGERPYASAARTRLISILNETGRYRVVKARMADAIMRRAGIRHASPPTAETVRKTGDALGVDAVICGKIKEFKFDEENRLVKVRENVWTGDYARDAEGVPLTVRGPGGKPAPKKLYAQRLMERNRLKRIAVLQIHYTMSDTAGGNAICSETVSESGSWEGTGPDEIAGMPGKEMVFDLLLDRATKDFVKKIAPHPIKEERVLETGTFHIINLGVELAKNNLWDEAAEKWLQAAKASPDEPASYYNLGVAFERKGFFDLAYKAYQNALARNPKSRRYIKAIAHIQKLMNELQ